MRCRVTITPDDIKPESKWRLDQGLDTIGTVEHYDWPADSKFADNPYELWTPNHKTGTPAPRFATLEEAAAHADELAEERARNSTLKPVQVHRETYRGIEFVITRHPATAGEHTRRFAHHELLYDNTHAQCPTGDIETVAKKLRGLVDTKLADKELLPKLLPLIDARHGNEGLIALTGTPKSGDTAYIWAMGRYRQGLVTKLGRTRITVSYTTASSQGRIFHKADRPADLKTAHA
ncbi:hypothetical protein WKI65_44050 [Streptomyces sp. MS1.AVA.3]|uniref:hypothetical protein n=1 Tax=Streptomyces decoyicus TaxID=249567 RepID=UPI0030C2FA7E